MRILYFQFKFNFKPAYHLETEEKFHHTNFLFHFLPHQHISIQLCINMKLIKHSYFGTRGKNINYQLCVFMVSFFLQGFNKYLLTDD